MVPLQWNHLLFFKDLKFLLWATPSHVFQELCYRIVMHYIYSLTKLTRTVSIGMRAEGA